MSLFYVNIFLGVLYVAVATQTVELYRSEQLPADKTISQWLQSILTEIRGFTRTRLVYFYERYALLKRSTHFSDRPRFLKASKLKEMHLFPVNLRILRESRETFPRGCTDPLRAPCSCRFSPFSSE